ncbi:NfeD family protein [Radiobacillus sp. PE A8.2]|uniref:NfeD family protein n=1 Tax=Radiobacillus sp. PE A8.2 TaxID=3380349 RepID=UPI0038905996
MLDIYWWMLWISLGFALIFLFLGDIIDGILGGLDEFFHPLLLFGTLSVIGGAGVLLTKYTGMQAAVVLLISILIGFAAYFLIYYFLVIPLSNAETSTSISINDLQGKTGEVITTIPAHGMGEVFIESTSGSRSETAKSFDEVEIKQGNKIVIVEVKDLIVYVSKMDDLY